MLMPGLIGIRKKNCCGMLRSCKISRERKTEIKPSKGPFQWNYAFPLNIFQDLNTLKACWHTCKLTSTEAFQRIPSEKKKTARVEGQMRRRRLTERAWATVPPSPGSHLHSFSLSLFSSLSLSIALTPSFSSSVFLSHAVCLWAKWLSR